MSNGIAGIVRWDVRATGVVICGDRLEQAQRDSGGSPGGPVTNDGRRAVVAIAGALRARLTSLLKGEGYAQEEHLNQAETVPKQPGKRLEC
jgi:hypothetical protein